MKWALGLGTGSVARLLSGLGAEAKEEERAKESQNQHPQQMRASTPRKSELWALWALGGARGAGRCRVREMRWSAGSYRRSGGVSTNGATA